tara:strand:+ start:722 stop:979 length:258 start_codon:yes stop_codon:yes gene_type:complete
MIRSFQIWLWGIVAELEFALYPWKTKEPPTWAVERYNLDHNIVDEYEDHMYHGWLKSLEDRTARLQLEMISVQNQINDLKDKPDV